MSTTHELTIQFPTGLEPGEELLQIAREGAERALREAADLQAKVRDLQELGIDITLAELLRKRRGASPKAASSATRRTRLTPAEKDEILAALKSGTPATALAERHGRSLGTIMNLKRQAGLTRPRR
ncbi:hypothetical protein [Haloferula sp. A504]|uniref:hypothetical protein n=1 Tax=Haloferula sp. A504 TaxID=3373601 RepID=UPI0031BDF2FF|nr:hypothetical protein [Verrucomicrobiaceae bacterium E54]